MEEDFQEHLANIANRLLQQNSHNQEWADVVMETWIQFRIYWRNGEIIFEKNGFFYETKNNRKYPLDTHFRRRAFEQLKALRKKEKKRYQGLNALKQNPFFRALFNQTNKEHDAENGEHLEPHKEGSSDDNAVYDKIVHDLYKGIEKKERPKGYRKTSVLTEKRVWLLLSTDPSIPMVSIGRRIGSCSKTTIPQHYETIKEDLKDRAGQRKPRPRPIRHCDEVVDKQIHEMFKELEAKQESENHQAVWLINSAQCYLETELSPKSISTRLGLSQRKVTRMLNSQKEEITRLNSLLIEGAKRHG